MAEERKAEVVDGKTPDHVSYFTFESEMTRMERTNHRLWILCILMLITLIGTNGAWLWYESQFEYFTESITQNAETENSENVRLIGGDYYGEGYSDDH